MIRPSHGSDNGTRFALCTTDSRTWSSRRARRIIAAGVAAIIGSALAGCALVGGNITDTEIPAIAPPAELSTKPRDQLLEESIAHTNDLVQLLGGEWDDYGIPPGSFDPNSRAGWLPGACDMDGIAERYSIDVIQIAPVADPLAKIGQVREHWKSLGHDVRQIGPADTDNDLYTGIFVDLPHGALLGFSASKQMMSIGTQSECVKQR